MFAGDAFFLHVQEKLLQTREGDVRTQYFMPTSADRYVTAYRQWLYKYAGEVLAKTPPSTLLSKARKFVRTEVILF